MISYTSCEYEPTFSTDRITYIHPSRPQKVGTLSKVRLVPGYLSVTLTLFFFTPSHLIDVSVLAFRLFIIGIGSSVVRIRLYAE